MERENLLAAITTHSVIAWAHINRLGEYDFSDEKLKDSVGILPPKMATGMRLNFERWKIVYKRDRYGDWKISSGAFRAFVGVYPWLKQWGIEVDGITDRKLPATVIIGDRVVCFRGNWKETLDEALDFGTYRELD